MDEDSSKGSQTFVQLLTTKPELSILQTTREEAISLVRRGKKAAYVVLKKGFGEAKGRMFYGDPAEIEIGLDPVRKAEAGMLQGVLTSYFMQGMQEIFGSTKKGREQIQSSLSKLRAIPDTTAGPWRPLLLSLEELDKFLIQVDTSRSTLDTANTKGMGSSGWQPLKVTVSDVAVQWEGPRNSFEVTFPQAIIWGLIGCAAAFGISLVTERTRGTLLRLRIAPLARWQILAGKALACFTTTVSVAVLLFAIGVAVFGIRPHSPAMLALAIVSAALCFVGIMMLLSVLGKTEASAGGVGWAVLLVMAMTGGGMVPLFFMPSWMKILSNLSPVKWAILTMEGAVWRGFAWDVLLFHCSILVAIGVVCFMVGAKVFSWQSADGS